MDAPTRPASFKKLGLLARLAEVAGNPAGIGNTAKKMRM